MTVVDIALFALVSVMLVLTARRYWPRRQFVWTICRSFRPLMALEMLALLIVTGATAAALFIIGAPFTWSWLLFLIGHPGNVLVTPIVDAGRQHDWLLLKLAGISVLLLLAVLMPFFVAREEKDFRRDRETWKRILPASLKFGLSHMLWAGVPLGAGLALTLPGLYFGWKYKRAVAKALAAEEDAIETARDYGVHVSTVLHTMYNTLVMLVLLIAILAT